VVKHLHWVPHTLTPTQKRSVPLPQSSPCASSGPSNSTVGSSFVNQQSPKRSSSFKFTKNCTEIAYPINCLSNHLVRETVKTMDTQSDAF
jgi:hypothetical protein